MAAAMVFTAAAFTLLLRPDATLRPGPRRSPAALEAHRGRSRKSKDIRQPSFGSAVSAAFSGEGEGELVRLVRGAVEEEHVARADGGTRKLGWQENISIVV